MYLGEGSVVLLGEIEVLEAQGRVRFVLPCHLITDEREGTGEVWVEVIIRGER